MLHGVLDDSSCNRGSDEGLSGLHLKLGARMAKFQPEAWSLRPPDPKTPALLPTTKPLNHHKPNYATKSTMSPISSIVRPLPWEAPRGENL